MKKIILSAFISIFLLSGCNSENPTLSDTDTGNVFKPDGTEITKPVASAGNDQSAKYNESVTLDATGSGVYSGSSISYEWKEGSTVLSNESSFSISTLSLGSHTITLTITDDIGSTDSDTMTVTVAANSAPVADAGDDQTVPPGEPVNLSASGSSDSDGSIVSYKWEVNGNTLSTASSFSISTLLEGIYDITLSVTDDSGETSTDTVRVVIANNIAPTADAGSDTTAAPGANVYLSASGSSDSDGSITSYQWSEGSNVLSTSSSFSISTLSTGSHTITLTVTDNDGSTDTDTVIVDIVAGNVSPTANAGADKTASPGEIIYFYSTGSKDEDGSIVSYQWKEGTTVLSNNSYFYTSTLSTGVHTITLTVTDNEGASGTDTVTATVDIKPVVSSIDFDKSVSTELKITTNYDPSGGTAVDFVFWKVTSPSGKTYTYDWDTTTNYTTAALAWLTLEYATIDVFDQDGTYTVETYVTNESGLVSTTYSDTVYLDVPFSTQTLNHNGLTYKTVESPNTGKVWLDRNLGATTVCAYSYDTSCYGDYYQWGRSADGHEKSTSATTAIQATSVINTDSKFIISSTSFGYDWAYNVDRYGTSRSFNWSKTDSFSICPVGFRVPTEAELKAETIDAGVSNRDDAFNSFLKLPAAGYRPSDTGTLSGQATWGYVWSNSVNGGNSRILEFGSSGSQFINLGRASADSIRCIQD